MTKRGWVVLAALAASCGGDDGGTGLSSSAEDLAEESARVLCGYLQRCGTVDELADCTEKLPELSSDVSAIPASALLWQYLLDLRGGELDLAMVDRCLAAIEAAPCGVSPFDDVDPVDACDELTLGGLAGGAACTSGIECQSQTCLPLAPCEDQCCEGLCTDPAPKNQADGSQCDSNRQCLFDSRCSAGGMCEPRGQTGATCTEDDDCARVLGCFDGTCGALRVDGEACSDGGRCAAGHLCDEACRVVRSRGESCGRGLGVCALFLYCNEAICDPWPTTGTCAPGEFCGPGAYCDADACTAKRATGDSCTRFDECQSLCNSQIGECVDGPIEVPCR